ncbi:MAG: hypothetical protein IT371_12025 [Deltaproteobacteria bacterium]|nr:hypothetical protein [Deltaproteobacteria bacterium]
MRRWLVAFGVLGLCSCSSTSSTPTADSQAVDAAVGDGPAAQTDGGPDRSASDGAPSGDFAAGDRGPAGDRGTTDGRASDRGTVDGAASKDASARDGKVADAGVVGHIVWAEQTTHAPCQPDLPEVVVAGRASGDFFAAGTFADSLAYQGTTVETQPRTNIAHRAQDPEGFLARVTATGTLSWLIRLGGDPWGARIHAVAATPSSGAYVAGRFNGPTSFDATTSLTSAVKTASPPTWRDEGFVARYDDAGKLGCVVHLKGNGTSDTRATSLAADSAGNAYVMGTYTKSVALDATTTLTAANLGVFVASYDTSCKLRWKANVDGGMTPSRPMAVGKNGTLYLHLIIGQKVTFTDGAGITWDVNQTVTSSTLVPLQAATGRFRTGSSCGLCTGPSDCSDPGSTCGPRGVCNKTTGGNAYGCFIEQTCQSCPSDPCPTGSGCVSNQCRLDADPTKCVRLYAGNGAQPILPRSAGAQWEAIDMALDANDNVFIVGSFKGKVQFINGNAAQPDGGTYGSMFVLALDPYLSTRWVNRVGHTVGEVRGHGVAIDAQGRIVVKGMAAVGADTWSQTVNTNGATTSVSTDKVSSYGPFYALFSADGKALGWSEASKAIGIVKSTHRSANLSAAGSGFVSAARFSTQATTTYGPSTFTQPPGLGVTRFYFARILP